MTSIIAFSAAWSASVTRLFIPSLEDMVKVPLKNLSNSFAPASVALTNVDLSIAGKDTLASELKFVNPGSEDYMIFNALAKVVVTKGSISQNHGLRLGIYNMKMIPIAEIKNKSQFFPEDAVSFIVKICANIMVDSIIISPYPCYFKI